MFYETQQFRNIDMDFLVDSEYWKENQLVIPTEARQRYDRLQLLRDLYNGDMRRILPKEASRIPIKDNIFEFITQTIVDILMAYPPTAEEVDNDIMLAINMEIEQNIRDYHRFGTSILATHGGILLGRWDPQFFFPTPMGYNYLDVFQDSVDVHIIVNDTYRVDTFDYKKENNIEIISPSTLGTQIDSVEYETIPNIYVCSRGESDGIWGTSAYYRLIPWASELSQILSGMSRNMRNYEHPEKVVFWKPENGSADFEEEDDSIEELDFNQRRQRLERKYAHQTDTNAARIEYIVPPMLIDNSSKMRDIVLSHLFVEAQLPQSFIGMYLGESSSRASGETMVQTQQMCKIMCRRIIGCFLPIVRKTIFDVTGIETEPDWVDTLARQQIETQAERDRNDAATENNNDATIRED